MPYTCRICGQSFGCPKICLDHEYEQHAIFMRSKPGEQLVFGITCFDFAWESPMAMGNKLKRAREELHNYFPGKQFEIQLYRARDNSRALCYKNSDELLEPEVSEL